MKWKWTIAFLLVALSLSLVTGGCIKRRTMQRERVMRGRSIEQVFDTHRDRLMHIAGVVGVGIGKLENSPAIVVMVAERTPQIDTQVPEQLDGYPVIVEVTGEFKAFEGQ
jgi:hypothetical protein